MLSPTDRLYVTSALAQAIVRAMGDARVTEAMPPFRHDISDLVEHHRAPRPQFCGIVLRNHKRSVVAAILDELWMQHDDPRYFEAEPEEWEGQLEYVHERNRASYILVHQWPLGVVQRASCRQEGGAA